MTTIRRRVLRPSPASAVADPRQAARNARQEQRLAKDRIALKRWLTRLKRAANTVADLHQRIGRLEANIRPMVDPQFEIPKVVSPLRARYSEGMSDVTRLLNAMQAGQPGAAEQLLSLVYDELRRIARSNLHGRQSGQMLQPTALVHEAYLRLFGENAEKQWSLRSHFLAAAAQAMRHILIDDARRKMRIKHGGQFQRVGLDNVAIEQDSKPDELLAIDSALDRLAAESPKHAELVNLHYFAGLSLDEVAKAMGISRATAYRDWGYARAWLLTELNDA